MRVIGGEFRSRRLKSLPGVETRPTPDRLRETLFNILTPRIAGAVFLDAYAGTGAVGIEALSRGASRAVFVERSRVAVEVIRENLGTLGIAGRAEVFCGKAIQVIERVAAEIVFLDPPYELEKEYESSLTALGSSAANLVIAQHARKAEFKSKYGALAKVREVRQGDNVLSFFSPIRAEGDAL